MKQVFIALLFVLASGGLFAQTSTSGQTQKKKSGTTKTHSQKTQAEKSTTPGSPTGSGGTGADDGSGASRDTVIQHHQHSKTTGQHMTKKGGKMTGKSKTTKSVKKTTTTTTTDTTRGF